MNKDIRVSFREKIKQDFSSFIYNQQMAFSAENTLRMDLHCHDHNSNSPDKIIGRILGVAETWLPTEALLKTLQENKTTALTVTNHNNARSCYELLEKGHDVLIGAEFSCTMPEYAVELHVLTYGFTPEQEETLKHLRADIYKFLEYTSENDIVTVLAHPLFFHTGKKDLDFLGMMDKLALMFDNFEALNGQRDPWHNLMVARWVQGLNEEELQKLSKSTGIDPFRYCRHPFSKKLTGGSDDHMGLYAGAIGTCIHIPDLEQRLNHTSRAQLVLEALKEGRIAPYGAADENNKMAISLLDYFCQCVLNLKDPGMLRILLHKGTNMEKFLSFGIANSIFELRRHKYTSKFFLSFHDALQGRQNGLWNKMMVSRAFRPVLYEVEKIATVRRKKPAALAAQAENSLFAVYQHLMDILAQRIREKATDLKYDGEISKMSMTDIIDKLELPSEIRKMWNAEENETDDNISRLNFGKFFDNLSFPLLASGVIAGGFFAAETVMNDNRQYLNMFSRKIGEYRHPRRALWLTDTFNDKNGVSLSIMNYLKEIQANNLPIDILVCDDNITPEGHLITVKPVARFELPFYKNQTFRVPDIMAIHKIFSQGCYDRIICSTEVFMGIVAIYLKKAFHVPAFFYMHTDWLEFAKRNFHLEKYEQGRIRRILRKFYRAYNGIFVLNADHKKWLEGRTFNISPKRIKITRHWINNEMFRPRNVIKSKVIPGVSPSDRLILFAGRISEEKGVGELPEIIKRIKENVPETRLVLLGTGPAEERLKKEIPDAIFMKWVPQKQLPDIFSACDALIFPSTFDTFGRVVLEAISCGLPVCAYNTKGPKDIIEGGVSGILANNREELAKETAALFMNGTRLSSMKKAAVQRARSFKKNEIISDFMEYIGFGPKYHPVTVEPESPEPEVFQEEEQDKFFSFEEENPEPEETSFETV